MTRQTSKAVECLICFTAFIIGATIAASLIGPVTLPRKADQGAEKRLPHAAQHSSYETSERPTKLARAEQSK